MNTPEFTVFSAQERLSALREEARISRMVRPRVSWRFAFPVVVLTGSLRPVRQTA